EREKRCARKVDAERWLDEQTAQHVTGTYVDPKRGKITVGAWADRWLAGKANLSASTRNRYAGIVEVHVRPRWGSVRLADVSHDDVQAWISERSSAGQAAASVVKLHRVLSMILAYAVRSRRLASNPADGVGLPKVGPAEKRYLRAEQVAALGAEAGPGRLVVLTLAYCGLRWGELAALKVSRLDLLRRRVHVAENVVEVDGGRLDWKLPKSHERRWVPLPRFLVDDLAEQVAGKAPDDLVFTSPKGAVLRVGNARRGWLDRAVQRSGAPDGFHPHELRHTAASLAVSAGANVKAVQRMLGHAKASMTLDVYTDLFDDDLEAVADRLDEIHGRAGKMRASGGVVDLGERRASG
ncbi:MAG: tyrosine-type recombinase/integrase, partial [Actinobacteria bacterium]|nr:tyrosine-type recombinase/integrase [Actinomycetota bacterium]